MPERSRPPVFLIVDQSLRDREGHHFEMDLCVARAAAAAGFTPIVVAHRACGVDLPGVTTRPWFTQSWTEAKQSRSLRTARTALQALPPTLRAHVAKLALTLRAALVGAEARSTESPVPFGSEAAAAIDAFADSDRDHVFVHTFSGPELHALAVALAARRSAPLIHLVLRREAAERAMNAGTRGGLEAIMSRIAADPCLARCVRLYTDTDALTEQHRPIAHGLPIATLPIPISPIDASAADEPRAPGPLRLVYLGNARTEKGFQLLPALAEALYEQRANVEAMLLAQANSGFSLDEHIIAKAKKRLAAHIGERVTLLEETLDEAAYHSLLLKADIVLLPYDAESYRRRSSGILIQALAAGRPVVVPVGSWLSDTAPAASSVTFAGPADFPRAVLAAIANYPALSAAARADAGRWRTAHNAEKLFAELLACAPINQKLHGAQQ